METTMHTFEIPTNELRALALFAGPKDIRPLCQHVWLDFTGAAPVLMATDGAAMLVIQAPGIAPPQGAPRMMYGIHADSIKAIAKGRDPLARFIVPTTAGKGDGFAATLSCGALSVNVHGATLAMNWRMAVPASVTGIADQYAPKYLQLCQDAAELLAVKRSQAQVHVGHNGPEPVASPGGKSPRGGAAVVRFNGTYAESAYAVVMPLRVDEPGAWTLPTWTRGA